MRKYESLAKSILKNVGGKDNIIGLTHCITRLRFNLKDESKANDEILKNMDGIVTVMKSAGQYQVVIGNHVGDVYDEVFSIGNITLETSEKEDKKQNIFNRFIDVISNIFQPILGLLTAAGMIKGLNAVLIATGTLGYDSGTYLILNAIGDAMFMFLPVFLGYTSAKKFKMEPLLGVLIGLILCYPAIQNSILSGSATPLYSVFENTGFESLVYLEFLNIPIIAIDYTSTVLPVIIICYFASKLENSFKRVIPSVVSFFFVPLLTMIFSVVAGLIIIGPITTFAANSIATYLVVIRAFSPVLHGFILGFFWQILVIVGLHWSIVPLYINNVLTLGYDNIMMPYFAGTFAQTAVVVAIYFKTKDKKLKSLCIPAAVSGIFGITEPAIYGITLPRKKPFIISCFAAGISGIYFGVNNFKEYILGGMGIFEFPSLINPATGSINNMMVGVIGVTISMIIAFSLTMVIFKDEEKETEKDLIYDDLLNTEIINKPIEGAIISLKEVNDAAFSSEALGKGLAIIPSKGEVFSPVNGVITVLYPTKHAIGITSENGTEILIHIGMNTVKLEGKYFTSLVEQGDTITKGQKIIDFDLEKIKDEGYSLVTPVLITNHREMLDIIEEGLTEPQNGFITVLH